MHSGRGADFSHPSTVAAAAVHVLALARRLGAVQLVVGGLALVIMAASLIGGYAAESSAEPTVRNFLLAWEQSRYWDAAGYTTGSPGSVAAALRDEYRQLGAAALFLNMGTIAVHGDHADARFYASVDLGQDGAPWKYQGAFRLRRVGTQWKVVWDPTVINPNLRPGLRLAVITWVPDRAPILDSAGQPLLRLSPVYELGVQPDKLRDPGSTAAKFAAVTRLDADQVLSQIRSAQPNRFAELLTLSPAAYGRLRYRLARVPGLHAHVVPKRLFSTAALSIVGTVTTEDGTQLRQEGVPYQPGTTVGLTGLQRVYQHSLAGTPTTEVVVEDRHANVVSVLAKWPGQPPTSVRTTIDARVQAAAAQAVRSGSGAAVIVAVRASTGHVLAVSYHGGQAVAYAALQGSYPPGGAFTIVSSAALLNTGFTADRQIPCAAAENVGGQTFTNNQPEPQVGAQPSFRADFANGCGTAFAGLSRLLNPSQLTSAAARFGIGTSWGLPLPTFTGSIPSPSSDAELAAETIGEGRVRISPLGMALVAATVQAGSFHRPILVTDPPDPGNVPAVPFRPELVNALRGLMRDTVATGAARAANLAGTPVFSQVGSAPTSPRHWANWFAGYRGDIAFSVLTLSGPEPTSAVPVAAQFLRDLEG